MTDTPIPWPGRPGEPVEPERDGWRIVRHKGNGAIVPRYWERDGWHAGVGVRWPMVAPAEAARMWDFVGDMLTPDAIAAERAASAAAMREACAKACEAERDEQQDAAGVAPHIKEPHAFAAAGAEICRVVIEALPLPSASALAAMIEAERARLARLVEAMVAERKQTGERVVLAIAARNVRRGRFLTDAEKVANLHKAMKEADDEAAFHAGAGEGGAS